MLTFRKDALLGRGHEDLGDCIEGDEGEGVEMGEGVAEIDQRRDEDQDVENEGSHIAEGHCGSGCGGGGGMDGVLFHRGGWKVGLCW